MVARRALGGLVGELVGNSIFIGFSTGGKEES